MNGIRSAWAALTRRAGWVSDADRAVGIDRVLPVRAAAVRGVDGIRSAWAALTRRAGRARRVAAVDLVIIDEEMLARLLAIAVDEAGPGEVMAPVAGPPGWTSARRDAFVEYHRSRWRASSAEPITEVTYAVTNHADVVGAARLAAVDGDPSALEVGLWVGRRFRGRGVAGAVLPLAAGVARTLGARRLIARTTSANRAAVAVLRAQDFMLTTEATGDVQGALRLD